LPVDEEWYKLELFFTGDNESCDGDRISGWDCDPAGKALKSTTADWTTHSTNKGDNSSDFTALPGGYRNTNGVFYNLKDRAHFWSSSEDTSTDTVWRRRLDYSEPTVRRKSSDKAYGFSIRCVQ